MKNVIFGTGEKAIQAMNDYKNIDFFVDNFVTTSSELCGISVLSWHSFLRLFIPQEYNVIVALGNISNRLSVCIQLEEAEIPYTVYGNNESELYDDLLHVFGSVDTGIEYIYNNREAGEGRIAPTISLLKACFEVYRDVFKKQKAKVDFYVYTYDNLIDAHRMCRLMRLEHIFAYSTISVISDKIIPIPDYRSCFDEKDYYYEETPEMLQATSKKPWSDNRVYFRGTNTSQIRLLLKTLEEKHPDKLKVELREGYYSAEEKISMLEYAKYKYQIGVPGIGWTDRDKILMQLGRVLFLVDRPHKEWYYNKLVPMKHYVPIKPDLSDLIEKYNCFEKNENLYSEMVKNCICFCEQYFNPDYILKYVKDIILKYGLTIE